MHEGSSLAAVGGRVGGKGVGNSDSGKVFVAPPGFMLTLQCGMNYSGTAGVGRDGPSAEPGLIRIPCDAAHRVSASPRYTPHMTYFSLLE